MQELWIMNYYEFLISHGSYSFACGELLPSLMILNCVTMNDEKFKETDTYLLFNKLFDAFCVFYTNVQWSESSDQWMIFFFFFHFALQDFSPFAKTMSLVSKLRYTEVLFWFLCLKSYPNVCFFIIIYRVFSLSPFTKNINK